MSTDVGVQVSSLAPASEQALYRLLRLFMPTAKKSECAHSAAPPLKPGPTSLGSGFVFCGPRFATALSISRGIESTIRSLAPPFQIEPVLCTGLRFGFLCPKLKNMLLLFEQAAYRLLRLFMPMAKKSECAHSAAPPPKPGPADAGLRVCFFP